MPFVSMGYAAHDAIGAATVANTMTAAKADQISHRHRFFWDPDKTRVLSQKWGQVFELPPETIMSIVDIESAHNPRKINMARLDKGGAWGLGQQMLDEADDKIKRIRRGFGKKFPIVKTTAKKWHGDPEALLDPDLNIMMTAWQLGGLNKAFNGDFSTIAAAYHQGAGKIRQRLRKGLPPVGKYQPKGQMYVSMAEAAHKKYEPIRPAPAMYFQED